MGSAGINPPEYWSDGVLECWVYNKAGSNFPRCCERGGFSHYSITPSFQYSLSTFNARKPNPLRGSQKSDPLGSEFFVGQVPSPAGFRSQGESLISPCISVFCLTPCALSPTPAVSDSQASTPFYSYKMILSVISCQSRSNRHESVSGSRHIRPFPGHGSP